jgi:hypothetical protein
MLSSAREFIAKASGNMVEFRSIGMIGRRAMDKRQRHNLLLILAVVILLLGVGWQVYLMIKAGESAPAQPAAEAPTQQQQ